MIKISMQYFAENLDTNPAENTEPDGNQNQQNTGNNSGSDGHGENKFTQADLNRIGAQEKANGKKSILKELGFDDESAAKTAIKEYQAWKETQKTESEKTAEKLSKASAAQSEAEKRADAAEKKLEILKAKGNPECVNDIMVLVSARINDTTDFNAALQDVQKSYPSFFGKLDTNNDTGTGGGLNHQRQKTPESNKGIGERLAQNRMKSTIKNPYFSN